MRILSCTNVFILLILFAVTASCQYQQDFTSPEATYATYLGALKTKDSVSIWRCWEPETFRFHVTPSYAWQSYSIVQKTVFDSLEIARRGYGEIGEVELVVQRGGPQVEYRERVFLVRVGENWKILEIID